MVGYHKEKSRKSVVVADDVIAATTGHSSEHSATDTARLSRYSTLSHQAGIRFFSPESYPTRQLNKKLQNQWFYLLRANKLQSD